MLWALFYEGPIRLIKKGAGKNFAECVGNFAEAHRRRCKISRQTVQETAVLFGGFANFIGYFQQNNPLLLGVLFAIL